MLPHPEAPDPVVPTQAMTTEPIIQRTIIQVSMNIFPSLPPTLKSVPTFVNACGYSRSSELLYQF